MIFQHFSTVCTARRGTHRVMSRALSGALLLSLLACEVPPIELEPTPVPTEVARGDYRLGQQGLLPFSQGADLDGDGTADNNLPLALDTVYATLQSVVLSTLAGSGVDPDQAWAVISGAMVQAGFPVSAEAYNLAYEKALRSGALTVIWTVSTQGAAIQGSVQLGQSTPEGVLPTGDILGTLQGSGNPAASLQGSLVMAYPQIWFSLPLLQADAGFIWNSAAISEGELSGLVLLESLVNAILSPIPESIEVNGTVVTVPKDVIARQLTAVLSEATTSEGELLCDLVYTDKPALSAAYFLRAQAVRVVVP